MADRVSVNVLGYPELRAGSRDCFERIDEKAPDAFEDVAARVASQVSRRVPRLTGRVARSVNAEGERGGALVQMGEGIRYAQFVEYGGRGHPHSPQGTYLYPTAIEAEPLLAAAAEQVADREIARTHWKTPS